MGRATSAASPDSRHSRLRVLHVAPESPGGIWIAVQGLLQSQLSDRYEMRTLVSARYSHEGRPVQRVRTFARALVELARWSRGGGDRLVHIHMAARGSWYRKSLCVAVAKLAGAAVIVHAHSGETSMAEFRARLGPARRFALRRLLTMADMVLSVSDGGARELGRWGLPAPDAIVPMSVPLPLAVEEWTDADTRQPARILYLGGFLRAEKGHAELVAALGGLVAAGVEFEAVLAGPGEPPSEAVELFRRPGIEWRGWLSSQQKDAEMAEASIFVLPSVSEGLPLALLEAMAYGRAIVATRVGGVPGVLTDGVDALLVEPGSPHELARALRTLIEDVGDRRRLGFAARASATRRQGDTAEERLARIYQRFEPALAESQFRWEAGSDGPLGSAAVSMYDQPATGLSNGTSTEAPRPPARPGRSRT